MAKKVMVGPPQNGLDGEQGGSNVCERDCDWQRLTLGRISYRGQGEGENLFNCIDK